MEKKKDVVYRYKEPETLEKKRPVLKTEYAQEIEKHMKKAFPKRQEKIFYEKVSEFVQVDIHFMEAPTPDQVHVLYTVGMSSLPMALPEELVPEFKGLERAELILLLPSQWKLELTEEEEDHGQWWVVNLMKYLAKFPHEYKTWIGWGHVVGNSERFVPYDKSTQLCGAVLSALQEEISIMKAKDGTQLNFYVVTPVYKEEMDMIHTLGAQSFFEKLIPLKGHGVVVFSDRPNMGI